MADVEITYKDELLTSMSETGSKTLKTAGKYMEDDVLIEYEKSAQTGLATGTFVVAADGFAASFDTGMQASEYNRLAIFCDTYLYTETTGFTQYENIMRFVDFTAEKSFWSCQSLTSQLWGNFNVGTDLSQGRWSVTRSGTTVSMAGYANAPKFITTSTYRWIAWNED